MEPQNKTTDLAGLRIDRREGPAGRRFLWPAVATAAVVAIAFALIWARRSGGVALRAPEVTTTGSC